jgi:hypothetical protein
MYFRSRSLRFLTVVLSLTLLTWSCSGPETVGSEEREALIRDFEATMSGATLAGYFSTGDGELSEEHYTIESVSHVQGDNWIIQSRIQYGEKDVTIPVPIQVKWAGDTPVLTLTDLTLPGLGTFTARVLIYRDQYAGTWRAGDEVGGQMFGRIER